MACGAAKTVYFVPMAGINAHAIFHEINSYRDEVAKPFIVLREKLEEAGYRVAFTYDAESLQDVAAIIVLNDIYAPLLTNLTKYPKQRCLHIIFEPPTVHPHFYQQDYTPYFGKIFMMFDDFIDNRRYFKFYYPQPRLEMVPYVADFHKKHLVALIAGNKASGHPFEAYSARRSVVDFFEKLPTVGEFNLFGSGWSGKNYRGTVESKWVTYSQHKFCFAYENMTHQRGYVTEKIFDAFVGGTVPVYLGATNITDYVPANCFIDRTQFKTENELYQFLKNMDQKTYDNYLHNIRTFLASPQAQKFSCESFASLILNAIQ